MDLRTIVKALRANQPFEKFAAALGVSHTAVRHWEAGGGVGPWNRLQLLAYARSNNASPKIVKKLERAQPKVGEART